MEVQGISEAGGDGVCAGSEISSGLRAQCAELRAQIDERSEEIPRSGSARHIGLRAQSAELRTQGRKISLRLFLWRRAQGAEL